MKWKIVLPILALVFSVESSAVPGVFNDVNMSDENALKALLYAVSEHNRHSSDRFLSQVEEVIKSQVQVVTRIGHRYRITAKLAKTPCRKDGIREVCLIPQDKMNALVYQCTFTVISGPWPDHFTASETC